LNILSSNKLRASGLELPVGQLAASFKNSFAALWNSLHL